MTATPSRPSPWREALAGLFRFQPAPRSRLVFSARAGLGIALPVLVASLAGAPQLGMVAAMGGLTTLYGRERPYRARAVELLVVAATFAVAVGLGHWIGDAAPWAVVPVVALFAMLTTWICNALRVGPPGAYLLMLSCAGGSAMPANGLDSPQVAALVFAGGLGAWLLHMAGALVDRRGPERRAVEAGAAAVRALVERQPAASAEERRALRRQASLAMHGAWQALVAWQPGNARSGLLARQRQIAHQWHLLLAGVVDGRIGPDAARARVAELDGWMARQEQLPLPAPNGSLPLGQPPLVVLLAQSLRAGSHERGVILRVGVAALVAGALASLAGLERSYWAIAAAVLMLHTGNDWTQTLQRALQRLVGTWTGLLLTAAVLWWHPQGLAMAGLLFLLQFTIEMLVMRNYAVAAVFITATGMTLASGGQVPPEPGSFLLARGLDTLLGCTVALAVLRWMPAASLRQRLDDGLAQTLQVAEALNSHLAWAELTSRPARQVRARLAHLLHGLDAAWEQGRRQGNAHAEHCAPVVMAVQELGYRLLATAWHLEHGEDGLERARALYGRDGVAAVQAVLRGLRGALAGQPLPARLPAVPAFLQEEVTGLVDAVAALGRPPREVDGA